MDKRKRYGPSLSRSQSWPRVTVEPVYTIYTEIYIAEIHEGQPLEEEEDSSISLAGNK